MNVLSSRGLFRNGSPRAGLCGCVLLTSCLPALALADSQAGELYASSRTVLLDDSRFVREAAQDRLQQIRYSYREPEAAPGQQQLWARTYGSWGSLAANGDAARLERDIGGLFVGADHHLRDAWVVGGLAGYSRSSLRVDRRDAQADIDSYHLALYAATKFYNQIGLKLGATYSQNSLASRRQAQGEHLRSDTDGDTLQAFVEGSYALDFKEFSLEPFANLTYVQVRTDGTHEKGGSTALQVSSEREGSGFATFGWRAATQWTIGTGQRLTARGSLGWRHALAEDDPRSDVRSPAQQQRFSSDGVELGTDSLRLDLSLDYELLPEVYVGLLYSGLYAEAEHDNGLGARLSLKF